MSTCILTIVKSVPTSGETPRRGFRIAEAAQYMGVSPWFVELQVRLFVRTGGKSGLPAVGEFIDGKFRKLCRHYTILREDMDAFLDSQRRKTA